MYTTFMKRLERKDSENLEAPSDLPTIKKEVDSQSKGERRLMNIRSILKGLAQKTKE